MASLLGPAVLTGVATIEAPPEQVAEPNATPTPSPAPPSGAGSPAATERQVSVETRPVGTKTRPTRSLTKLATLVATGLVVLVGAGLVSVLAMQGSARKEPVSRAAGKEGRAHAAARPRAEAVTTTKILSVPIRSLSDDPVPTVAISVGNDRTIRVILDTGSVGLRVFSNVTPVGAGHGIAVTSAHSSVEYGDGTEYGGVIADARIHIGSAVTAMTVPFQLVRSVECDPNAPACPAEGGATSSESQGFDGIMGIGLGGHYPGDSATNPLLALASPYRDSWSIAMNGNGSVLPASGRLTLGAPDPSAPDQDAAFDLQENQQTVDGSPSWNDQFNLCWDVGGESECEMSIFDSGTTLTLLEGTDFTNVPTDDPGEVSLLTSGTNVVCSQEVDGSPLWSFNAGSGAMGTVYVDPFGEGLVISGVQVFYSHTVTYDEAHGVIYLS